MSSMKMNGIFPTALIGDALVFTLFCALWFLLHKSKPGSW